MNLIEKFAKEVLKDNLDSFVIKIPKENKDKGNITYYFLQNKVGNAKYIYGGRDYWNEKFYNAIDFKPELVAIVSDGKVYILNEFMLEVPSYMKHALPNNVFYFYEEKKEINKFVEDVIFKKFYKSLKPIALVSTPTLEEKARKILLLGNKCVEKPQFSSCFNEQDMVDILCGFIDVEAEAERRLQEGKAEWIKIVSENEKLDYLICNPDEDVAEPWEIEIADALNSVEAKTVTVEFLLNGKTGFAKIDPQNLLRNLLKRDYLSSWDFTTSVSGEKLLKELGASASWSSNEPRLTCEHITKITYGKKVLYTDV